MRLRVAALIIGSMLVFAVALRGAFALLDLGLEQHGVLFWTCVCSGALIVGAVAGARCKRVVATELWLSTLALLEVAIAWAWMSRTGPTGLSSAPFRALLVGPAAYYLCAYFGASLGYLLRGSGRVDLRMGYELIIARRFLLAKGSPVLSTVTTISVIGVALGVWLVAVSLGVLSGFEVDLQQKIIGANGHVVLQRGDRGLWSVSPALMRVVDETPGVQASSPIVQADVAVASASNYTVAMLFGMDPRTAPRVITVLDQLNSGSLQPLIDEMRRAEDADQIRAHAAHSNHGADDAESDTDDVNADAATVAPAPIPGIAIGLEMASILNVKVGDRIRIISPTEEVLTPIGVAPASATFEVKAIFASKMYEYDARYAYVTMPAARKFLHVAADQVSGVQIITDAPAWSEQIGDRVLQHLHRDADASSQPPPSLQALDWKRRNQTLFASLKLERVVAFVVLVFIILVASFSIVNTLSMSVMEKRKEIAILKTMGAHDVGIMKLFLTQGMLVGSFGVLIGTWMALLTVKSLEHFGFWIPGDVYYIDALPVRLEVADLVLVALAAHLIVWNFAVFPALRGAQLAPVQGLRDG